MLNAANLAQPMPIITVPHPTLRQVANPVMEVDKKLSHIVEELQITLAQQNRPRGVGLAAPQIDISRRVFATLLPDTDEEEDAPATSRVFINPEITDHSEELVLGTDPEDPLLEGCLSIPGLYGPVPRWEEIRVRYFELINGELVEKRSTFNDFHARVFQHELDHLDGILFTDYSLKYDLPIYKENKMTKKLEEIDPRLVEIF